jgi:hypothetical protein
VGGIQHTLSAEFVKGVDDVVGGDGGPELLMYLRKVYN